MRDLECEIRFHLCRCVLRVQALLMQTRQSQFSWLRSRANHLRGEGEANPCDRDSAKIKSNVANTFSAVRCPTSARARQQFLRNAGRRAADPKTAKVSIGRS